MSVPEPLLEWINGARSSLERANFVDANHLARNASAFLTNAETFVQPTAVIVEAFARARTKIERFRSVTAGRVSLPDDATVREARQDALDAIERLCAFLDGARPSETAKALGNDWF